MKSPKTDYQATASHGYLLITEANAEAVRRRHQRVIEDADNTPAVPPDRPLVKRPYDGVAPRAGTAAGQDTNGAPDFIYHFNSPKIFPAKGPL